MCDIPCPSCRAELIWKSDVSRWECACGKTILVTVLNFPQAAKKVLVPHHALRTLNLQLVTQWLSAHWLLH
jgi:hypothetical protein